MDPVSEARALVDELFPEALYALLGGSVAAGRRTPTSDLDILVVVDGLAAPYRESLRRHDWPVELLVHSQTSFGAWLERDFGNRQPVLARLCAEGIVLADRSGGRLEALREELRGRLERGPGAPHDAALGRARYVLSDLLDDLAGVTDPGERAFIEWNVVEEAARLALSLGGRWQGGGKWLLRELRAHDPELAQALLKARETPGELAAVAGGVLERAGGRLWEGYRADGDVFHRPLRHLTPEDLSGATAQSAGMRRLAAVSDATTGSRRLWMGQTHVAPATRSADHHHGESETAIYVVSGRPVFVFLEDGGERRIETGPGDYVFVPPFVPHREENPDPEQEAVVVIARSTQEAIVVDLPDLRMR
ncbi:cupin domain-containing protein [Nonomuraea sp. NPDC049486]|uniref:cupin domain-containing protein n=1 Tax=unclassified Nonomuraea TaxID=2593643 RepID=UPI0021C2E4E1|nr:cupin domain-containing protein [Nonomuraea sp. C10]